MRLPGSIPTWFRDVFINGIVGATWFPRVLRWAALRLLGVDAQRSTIGARVIIAGSRNVKIGKWCSINESCYLGAHAGIVMEDYSGLGARVEIHSADHVINNVNLRHGKQLFKPVRIGRGSMIGGSTVILPGVTIGEGAVVGAGSLVIRDLEPNALYVGSPARLVRRLEPLREVPRESEEFQALLAEGLRRADS